MSFFSCREDFPEIWRFEECPDLMESVKTGAIVFFNRKQTNVLWPMLVSSEEKNLMKMNDGEFSDVEKYDVDFKIKDSADKLFDRLLERAGALNTIILFFDVNSACTLNMELLRKFWNEIFLISDETAIAIDVKSKIVMFSFEDRFFIATR